MNNKNLELDQIINDLNKYLCIHIKKQIDHGADVIQVFDSWAGLISHQDLSNYCYIPNLKIVDFCKKKGASTVAKECRSCRSSREK